MLNAGRVQGQETMPSPEVPFDVVIDDGLVLDGDFVYEDGGELWNGIEGDDYEIIYEDFPYELEDDGIRPPDGEDANAGLDPLIYATGAPAANQRFLTVQENLFDLLSSGLPMALAQRDMMRGISGVASQDVNGRLQRLRSRLPSGTVTSQGDSDPNKNPGKNPVPFNFMAEEGSAWSIFASANYKDSDFKQRTFSPAFDSQTYAGTLGLEWRATSTLTLGFGGAYVHSDSDFRELGDVETEGFVLMPYLSYARGAFYGDLLYGYGSYENEVNRRSLGSSARGKQDAEEHEVQFNTGHNFRAGKHLVHGPTLGLRYVNGKLDEYTQSGGAASDLTVAEQDYESLVSRLGWQFSFPIETGAGRITPHLRAAWSHEFLDSDQDVSVSNGLLVSLDNTDSLEEDGLAVGAGVTWDMCRAASLSLDYDAEVLRSDFNSHWVSVRFELRF